MGSHSLPLTKELALASTLYRQVPTIWKQMKFSSSAVWQLNKLKRQVILHNTKYDDDFFFFTESKGVGEGKLSLTSWLEFLFWHYLAISLCFEESRRKLWSAFLLDQTSPDGPSLVHAACKYSFPQLWQTLRHCVFFVLKNSPWYFFCVCVSTTFLYSKCFPLDAAALQMLLISYYDSVF